MKLKDTSGGMLLYTVVIALLTSFTAAALAALSINHYYTIENEINRKEALSLVRAGFEYAYAEIADGSITPPYSGSLPGYPGVGISVDSPSGGAPSGVDWEIQVTANY